MEKTESEELEKHLRRVNIELEDAVHEARRELDEYKDAAHSRISEMSDTIGRLSAANEQISKNTAAIGQLASAIRSLLKFLGNVEQTTPSGADTDDEFVRDRDLKWMTKIVPLSVLHLSAGPENALKANGVDTVNKLTELTEHDLWLFPNIGRASIRDVKVRLASMGLSLRKGGPKVG